MVGVFKVHLFNNQKQHELNLTHLQNLLLTYLAVICFFLTSNLNAQQRKTVVVKKNNNRTIVYKKQAVYKHKRAKRTIIVHHHYKHLPKRGAIVSTLHANAIIVKHRNIDYHFHSGIWYKPHGKKWVVVHPPHGLRIKTLPVGYRKVFIGPKPYYYYYGIYYALKNNEYEVVEAPLGAELDSLPDGYNTINVNGEDYYELDGVYYTTGMSEYGEEVLIVVKNPRL